MKVQLETSQDKKTWARRPVIKPLKRFRRPVMCRMLTFNPVEKITSGQ
jgi:hypothetical protein